MSAERARKNVLLRHPILIGFATIVILAVIFMPKGEEYKKLDYSKPVYTGESAIVCPKSLLFDLRADHGPNAIFEAFTAVLHRDEKARALGCEIVRGGIPVTAHRMSSPYDEYVSLSLGGTQSADFFTMEGDLENGTSTENSANDSTGTPKTAAQVMLDGYRDDLSRFQKQFPTLEKPIPNLRWFDDHVEGADAQEDVELVTPFGPCISMIGNFWIARISQMSPVGFSAVIRNEQPRSKPQKSIANSGTYQNRVNPQMRHEMNTCGLHLIRKLQLRWFKRTMCQRVRTIQTHSLRLLLNVGSPHRHRVRCRRLLRNPIGGSYNRTGTRL
jgi:hypothetical protein